jgi:allantoate deiminase
MRSVKPLAEYDRHAATVMQRLEALGKITDEPGRLTRTFGSPAMRRANELVASWMRKAGMTVRRDAIGNLIGRYVAQSQKSAVQSSKSKIQGVQPKVLLLGSHLDTVRDAGKFDGALGVLAAIACLQELHDKGSRLPFAVDVVGFADEEGVRYATTYLGSSVFAGTFARRDLKRRDANGITMEAAIRSFGGHPDALVRARLDPDRLLGYVEVHIEQGPVLEQKNLAVGVVSAINGQTRAQLTFNGCAGHAGTTPMNLRRDALCAAAEFVSRVEELGRKQRGVVATVGELDVLPGASNVIPGEVRLSLDVRHQEDARRRAACAALKKCGQAIASKRKLRFQWQAVSETRSVQCDERLSGLLGKVVSRHQKRLLFLTSGAGHDAAALGAVIPVAMLFVRCKDGLSHHPAEHASQNDVRIAISVLVDFLQGLASCS